MISPGTWVLPQGDAVHSIYYSCPLRPRIYFRGQLVSHRASIFRVYDELDV